MLLKIMPYSGKRQDYCHLSISCFHNSSWEMGLYSLQLQVHKWTCSLLSYFFLSPPLVVKKCLHKQMRCSGFRSLPPSRGWLTLSMVYYLNAQVHRALYGIWLLLVLGYQQQLSVFPVKMYAPLFRMLCETINMSRRKQSTWVPVKMFSILI